MANSKSGKTRKQRVDLMRAHVARHLRQADDSTHELKVLGQFRGDGVAEVVGASHLDA